MAIVYAKLQALGIQPHDFQTIGKQVFFNATIEEQV